MRAAESRQTRQIVGRLNRYDKLPGDLLAVARKFGVKAGRVHAIGGVTKLAVTEYDVVAQQYREPLRREGMTEVLSLEGNLSLRDGELFGHLHINASYEDHGEVKMVSGHLVEAEVFVCEFHIVAYDDVTLVRELDPATGLALWSLPDKE
jgi:predicted DNA-binding protein with PD1-like motif